MQLAPPIQIWTGVGVRETVERQRTSSKTFFMILFLNYWSICETVSIAVFFFPPPDLLLSPLAIACPHKTLHPPSFGKASSHILRLKKKKSFLILFLCVCPDLPSYTLKSSTKQIMFTQCVICEFLHCAMVCGTHLYFWDLFRTKSCRTFCNIRICFELLPWWGWP